MAGKTKGMLFIVSGPAGSGKTTLCEKLLSSYSQSLERVITSTTRKPREGEVDGVDYHFFSKADFEQKIENGDYYEHAIVHRNHYGTLKSSISNRIDDGVDLVLNVDVQGAKSIWASASQDQSISGRVVSIFIMTADLDVLRARLKERGKDSHEEIEKRLITASKEMAFSKEYDYQIVTGSREDDYKTIEGVYLKHASIGL